ncbi:GNAT family N-acetyltransferase [Methylomonas sp. LW13]|uniref:GNAT family N-acetyltransferase n=1 Tax=unclassified Methylomonas TaxID=2608980 RepID=UPI0006916C0E|nr:GNAT family N-acetyltransferase [Methylomonas sp. LW13]QBC26366.1 GNAT family N-acetyltransferase [Methylomonas sp. LW13]
MAHRYEKIDWQTTTLFVISPMSIRLAIPADAKAIGQIRVAAWRAAYQPFMPSEFLASLDPSANLDALTERLTNPTREFMVFVAEDEGNTVGFSIIGAPRYQTQELTVELWALNVSPAHWRQGLGRKLVDRSVAESFNLGFACIELWCIKGNSPAEAAYAGCGFTLTDKERTSSALTGHPLHEVLYSKIL